MVAFNFQKQFAPDVESGAKPQTIRAPRKRDRKGLPNGQPCAAGEALQLYTGMRTKACRKLADAICTTVMPIAIYAGCIEVHAHFVSEHKGTISPPRLKTLSSKEAENLAKADGFNDYADMLEWFKKTHGLPFKGFLIEWKLVSQK